jgi:hypothetical protein
VTFIVLEKEAPTQVGEALMCSVLVPHASAKLQNDREAFQPGDMIRLTVSTYDNLLDQIWVKQNLAISKSLRKLYLDFLLLSL